MLVHVYSGYQYKDNKSSDFLFFSAILDLQSIRDDEATTSIELIFFNAMTDVFDYFTENTS